MAAAQEGSATAVEMWDDGDSEKKGGANKNRESLTVYKNDSSAAEAGGGGKAMKTVGNATVASDSPSDYSTAARSGGGGAKFAAANVKAATEEG